MSLADVCVMLPMKGLKNRGAYLCVFSWNNLLPFQFFHTFVLSCLILLLYPRLCILYPYVFLPSSCLIPLSFLIISIPIFDLLFVFSFFLLWIFLPSFLNVLVILPTFLSNSKEVILDLSFVVVPRSRRYFTGMVQSLNLSTAAAIFLAEIMRQRHHAEKVMIYELFVPCVWGKRGVWRKFDDGYGLICLCELIWSVRVCNVGLGNVFMHWPSSVDE